MECPVEGCNEWLESKRRVLEHRRHDHGGSGALLCKMCVVWQRFGKMSSLQQHCTRFHDGSILSASPPPRPPNVVPPALNVAEANAAEVSFGEDVEMDGGGSSEANSAPAPESTSCANELQQFFAQQMGRGVPRSSLDSFAQFLQRVLHVGESGDPRAIAQTDSAISSCLTHYKRTQLGTRNGDILTPQKCQMGVIQTTKRDRHGEAVRVEQGEYFYVFELEEVLRQAVQFARSLNLLKSCCSDRICCHKQGERYKTVADETQHATPLPFLLYGDDVSPGSSLGPKAAANSLCLFQIKLAGHHLDASSALASKFVYATAYAKDHSAHSFLPILDVLKQQLASIYDRGGLRIGDELFHPVLLSVIADNKAHYEFRGLKLNYNRCRLCLVDSANFLTVTNESQVQLKDRQWYDQVCSAGLAQHHGFKDACPLDGIPGYDFMNDCSMDLMHDVLEGEAQRATIRLLRALDRRGLKLQRINAIMSNLPYGKQDSSSRPSPFKVDVLSGTSISQRASQVHTLMRLLPLALHFHTDLCDFMEWESFVLLGKVLLTLLQPSFTERYLARLEDLVARYIDSVREIVNLFPGEVSMTIKSHHLVHYARFVRLYGPPILNWCIDFEQLNASIKSHSYMSRNAQNLPFSMINHAQHFLASQRASFNLEALPRAGVRYYSELPSDSPLISIIDDLAIVVDMLCYRIDYHGMCYSDRDIVVLSAGALPSFGQIRFAVYVDGEWQLVIQKCETISWLDSINCYTVQMSDVLCVVSFENLNSAHPLDSYFFVDVVYIPIRHFPLE